MKNKKFFLYLIFFIYIIILIWILLFPKTYWSYQKEIFYNLIPFKTIEKYLFFNLYRVNNDTIWENLIWNIIIFIPLWLLIPLVFKNFSNKIIIFLWILTPIFIEIIQFFSAYYIWFYKVADIDDAILWIFWFFIWFFIFKIWQKIFLKKSWNKIFYVTFWIILTLIPIILLSYWTYLIYSIPEEINIDLIKASSN